MSERKIIYLDGLQEDDLMHWLQQHDGNIVRKLPLINAVVCEFSKALPTFEVQGLNYRGLKGIEDDVKISLIKPLFFNLERIFAFQPVAGASLQRIGADKAWQYSRGKGVKVAVLDTGIDYRHPDLARSVAGGVNVLKDGKDPLDDNGHGTHISGIIGGYRPWGNFRGIAPEAQLFAVKALDGKGEASVSDIIAGIQWCIDNNMDLVNMSFGTEQELPALYTAVNNAYRKGLILVSAAGNTGKPNSVQYPAKYRETVAVSALGLKDRIAKFSSTGQEVNITAPGEDIYSTWLNGQYKKVSGTSIANPHIVGTLALVLSLMRSKRVANLTNRNIVNVVYGSATRLANLSTLEQGVGMVSALNAVRKVNGV